MATDAARYVVEQVACDGDQGCSPSRLHHFIDHFHDLRPNDSRVDDHLRTFILSSVLRHPAIHAGRARPTANDDLDNASKNGVRAGKRRARDVHLKKSKSVCSAIDVDDDTAQHGLPALIEKFGEAELRIVADDETITRTIAGNGPPLNAGLRRFLMTVTRAREDGVSFQTLNEELNSSTQNTFFYCKTLEERSLVVRMRSEIGTGSTSNIVLATRFAHLNSAYRTRRMAEEIDIDGDEGNGDAMIKAETDADDSLHSILDDPSRPSLLQADEDSDDVGGEDEEAEGVLEQEEDVGGHDDAAEGSTCRAGLTTIGGLLAFPAFKTRDEIRAFATDKKQIRLRLLQLMMESKNRITESANLVHRLGVMECSSLERRAIRSVLTPMEEGGLIRRRWLLRLGRSGEQKKKRCYEVLPKGVECHDELSVTAHDKAIRKMRSTIGEQLARTRSELCLEMPFERQIIERIARAGPAGMTIEALNTALGGSDERKRDIDRIVNMSKVPTFPQYADTLLFSALEQDGRLRYYRYWTQQWRPEKALHKDVAPLPLRGLRTPIDMPGETYNEDGSVMTTAQQKKNKKKKEVWHDAARPRQGRPRKHCTPKALAAAARYQAKKLAASRLAKADSGESESESEVAVMTWDADDPSDEPPAAKRLKVFNGGSCLEREPGPSPMLHRASVVLEESAESAPETMETTDEIDLHLHSVEKEGKGRKPLPMPSSSPRFNLTLQLKYEKFREFMRHVGIIDGSQILQAYALYLRDSDVLEQKRGVYDMDTKMRQRLLAKLERSKEIESCMVTRPAPKSVTHAGRPKIATIYYLVDMDPERVREYGRGVSSGEIGRTRQETDRMANEQPDLTPDDVEATLGFVYRARHNFNVGAESLTDLLEKPQYRDHLLRNNDVRSYYTGWLRGVGARMQFLHEQSWQFINNAESSMSTNVKSVDRGLVVDLRWWATEATLGAYLRFGAPPVDEELLRLSRDSSMLATPLKDVPQSLRKTLGLEDGVAGMHRALEAPLRALVLLGLVAPVRCAGNAFDIIPFTPNHTLYRFKQRAPLYVWNDTRLMQSTREVNFSVTAELCDFWAGISLEPKWRLKARELSANQLHEASHLDATLVATLADKHAWYATYRILEPQRIFLQRCVELGVEAGVLQDPVMLQRLSYAAVTPTVYVQRFLQKLLRVPMRRARVDPAQRSVQTARTLLPPTFLARKSGRPAVQKLNHPLTKRMTKRLQRQTRQVFDERASEFDDIIVDFMKEHRFASNEREILRVGLQRARKAYGDGNRNMSRDQLEQILESIARLDERGQTDSYNAFVRQTTAPRSRRRPKPLARRSNAAAQVAGEENNDEEKPGRKAAFEWTTERDELLRDCCVILRSRDKYRAMSGAGRKNWIALRQVFDQSSMAGMHGRFEKLQAGVGEEAYLAQLEVEWERLWTRVRGTDALADADPKDPAAFDLMEHVRFLRLNINKYEVLEVLRRGTDEPLPADVIRLRDVYDLDRPACVHFVTDPNALVLRRVLGESTNEMRNDRLARFAFSIGMFDEQRGGDEDLAAGLSAPLFRDDGERTASVAMDTVKMVLSTGEERYDEALADRFCTQNSDGQAIDQACRSMMQTHVVKTKSKSSEARSGPGRGLMWHDDWQAFMSDANLETVTRQRILSTIADNLKAPTHFSLNVFRNTSDEGAAASLTLICEDAAKVTVDLSSVQDFSHNRLFNAKRLTDAMLEMSVLLLPTDSAFDATTSLQAEHEHLLALIEDEPKYEPALAWLGPEDTVDNSLVQRWTEMWTARVKTEGGRPDRQDCANRLLRALRDAGADGLDRRTIMALCSEGAALDELVMVDVITSLLAAEIPLAFDAGHALRPRLVAACHLHEWTVEVVQRMGAEVGHRRIFAHPWLDMYGDVIAHIWHDAVALVLQAIVTHPGVTLAQVVVQMQTGALGRRDVLHIVTLACQAGLVERIWSVDPTVTGDRVSWLARHDGEVALSATS